MGRGQRPILTRPLFIYGRLRDPRVRAQLFGARADLTTCPATLPGHERQTVASFDYPFIQPPVSGMHQISLPHLAPGSKCV